MAQQSTAIRLGEEMPKMTILSDRPTDTAAEDFLGLESRLSAVLDILRHQLTKPPITIAIYGDWGTGKTSALRWLESQLKSWNELSKEKRQAEPGKIHPLVYPVWFDPWKYHSREDVWRGIISEVILSLFDARNLDRQDFVPRMREAAKKFGAFLGKGFLHALAGTELKLTADSLAAGAEVTVKGEMFREIYEEFDRASHPEKAYLNQFEDALKSWVNGFLQQEARVALFIDDLDRCLPEVTLEVLEAIKLYLNIPQILFVVGLDRDVVDKVVAKHYADHGLGAEKAGKYLDKIFQVEIQISPSETQMTDFRGRQIALLDESTGGYWGTNLDPQQRTILEAGISELAKGNPRELKRLLNSALLRGRAAADNAGLRNRDASGPLFAQGVQFFLAQKIVEKWFGRSSNLLLRTPVLEWFDQWSAFARANPDFRPRKPKRAEEEASLKGKAAPAKPSPEQEKAETDFKAISAAALRHDDDKPVGKQLLLDEELLWKLLQIPFSVEVAQSAPNVEPPKPAPTPMAGTTVAEDSIPAHILRAMPDLVRGRIARAQDKSVDQLTTADLAAVKKLDLGQSEIKDADLLHLEKLTGLKALDLRGTEITDAGLKSLEKLTALKALDLEGTKITDAGLKSLEKLTALQDLYLWGTKITDAGLDEIKKALPKTLIMFR